MTGKTRGKQDHKRDAKQVGLVRYKKEDWERWRQSVDDGDLWEETFEEWQQKAEAMAARLRAAGLKIVWVDVAPDQISRWCEARGLKNNGEARSLFAAESIGNVRPTDAARSPKPQP